MNGWLILTAYEIITLVASRLAYAELRADMELDSADRFDNAAAGFFALVGGHLWPLLLPIAAVMWKPRKTPNETLEENRLMQQRIAELERELGIGGTR